MANPLPNEQELYERIAKEQIKVHPELWTAIYHYISDSIIVINLIVRYFIDKNQTIPKQEARRILDHADRMTKVYKKLIYHELIKDDEKDPLFKTIKQQNLRLHPVVHELFTHHMPNNINIIKIIVSDYLDPMDGRETISTEHGKKILSYAHSTIQFLDKLREATSKKEVF